MSKNSLLNLVIAFVLAVLVGLTILEGTATSSVVRHAEAVTLNERGLAADTARWEAIAKAYTASQPVTKTRIEPGRTRSRQSMEAETARWDAIAESYSGMVVEGVLYSERGIIADAARWTAIADHYLASMASQTHQKAPLGGSNQRSQRSIEAEAARWNAIAEFYLSK